MSGTYSPVTQPDARLPLSFSVRVDAPSLMRHARDGRAELVGTLHAEGLASGVPITGTMLLRPFPRGRIAYDFRFTGDDGQPYVFQGQKDIRVRTLIRSFTELPAEIRSADGTLVATSETKFALAADLVSFLRSFGLTRRD